MLYRLCGVNGWLVLLHVCVVSRVKGGVVVVGWRAVVAGSGWWSELRGWCSGRAQKCGRN